MKIDEHFSPRTRMLLFSTLELLRKEIRPQFSDWKDVDDWLFAQLDFTKKELAQIYKGRNVLYFDGSAVDFEAAQKRYEASLPDFVAASEVNILGQNLYLGSIKLFLGEDQNLLCKLPDESDPRNLRISIRDVREGDAFFFGETGTIRTTSDNAYQNHDEPDEPWVVYGDDGEVYFEEDIISSFGNKVKDFLIGLSQKLIEKPTLDEQVRSASVRVTECRSAGQLPVKEASPLR